MKTLVIGASTKAERYSNIAMNMLLDYKHEVVALGRKEADTDIVHIDSGFPGYKDVDTVSLYVGPKNQEEYIPYVISLNPRRVIFNPGTENPDFYQALESAGIDYEVACTLVLLRTGQF